MSLPFKFFVWLTNISIHIKCSTLKAYTFSMTLSSYICKKINVEWFIPEIFITMLPWVFYATQLFQSIPAGLSVELLTSLWGTEWVPEMHLSPPERGCWPKTDEKITYYLKAPKKTFLKIESSCSSTSNLKQWPHVMMTTMNASFRKTYREQNTFFPSLNEVHTPTLVYSEYTYIFTHQTKRPPLIYSLPHFPWSFLITS